MYIYIYFERVEKQIYTLMVLKIITMIFFKARIRDIKLFYHLHAITSYNKSTFLIKIIVI